MRITNSMAKTFNRCPNQYRYKFVWNIVPNRIAHPLKRGTWLHRLLEAHYYHLMDPDKYPTWEKVLKKELQPEYDKLFDEEKEYYGDLPAECYRIMRAYVYHWRKEDAEMEVLALEFDFEVSAPHGHTIKGRVDGVVRDAFGIWLFENKSHKTIPRSDYRFLDVQTTLYRWALNKTGEFGHIDGILWNYLRTKPPTVPTLMTQTGRISRRKVDTELLTFLDAVRDQGLNPRDFRDTIRGLQHSQSWFVRHRVPREPQIEARLIKQVILVADQIERGFEPIRVIDRSCEYSCSYLPVCMTQLYGGDYERVIRNGFHVGTKEDYYGYDEAEKLG